MIIDTQKKVISTQLRRMITILVYAAIVIIVLVWGKPSELYFGLSKYNWALIITGLYVIYLTIEGLMEYNYIFLSVRKEFIILRYFSLGFFNRKKNSIEIPVKEFSNYEIENGLFGKKKVVLYRSYKDKEAKYPPVSLSLLSQKEITTLKKILNNYISKK
ncbi:MAG: hypothetical protein JXA77_15675 [Bacteroidales bacterium]|nr:hypothetical protein [Bacteroidales bacterium]MBN2821470.1 hypothetical protein [Bacteroidales bacterium]